MLDYVYHDEVIEWKLLAGLFEKENLHYLHMLTPALFTDHRVKVYRACMDTFTVYGLVSMDGFLRHYHTIPGELLAAQQKPIQMRPVYDSAVRLAKKRQLRERAERMKDLSEQFDPEDYAIDKICRFDPISTLEDSTLYSGAVQFLGELHAKRDGTYQFTNSGIPFINMVMGGEWKPKTISLICAKPGSGKTLLIGNSILRMAENNISSLFFSLEMAKDLLISRWAADLNSIDNSDIIIGNITRNQLQAIEKTVVALQKLPMFVIDNGSITLSQMVKYIRDHVLDNHVRVVFVDYLQIVNHSPTNNKNADLGEAVRVFKRLAKELSIHICIISQMNKNGEGTDAVRDTGEAANEADIIIFLKPQDKMTNGMLYLDVELPKNRLGPTITTIAVFNGAFQRFEGLDYKNEKDNTANKGSSI